ncbi:thioredoxin reductase [Aureobasidium sp. EXF-10728]|nr:thioredoxin reductase [Aureobasidium sp. EXF-10728]
MNHPYQITALCNSQAFAPEGLLLAACGDKIVSVKLSDGSIISQWPEQKDSSSVEAASDGGPPGKKRKLESEAAAPPNVIKLAVAADDKHIVAVTDDKSVRVLEVTESVLVTPDNQTILCGDKFGDVYSLPLFPSAIVDQVEESSKVEAKEDAGPKKYVPAATTLTVHSGRNRRALENQMKQKDLQAKAREGPKFEYQLLLGHVSMLTDVQFATEEIDGKARGYIITADRDEHIRISRGPPQAHIIEGFCLGHKDFISKICLLPGTDLLGSASRVVGISLPGAPLDVTVVGNTVLVSLDVTEASTPRLQAYRVCDTGSETNLELDEGFGAKLHAANNLMLPAPERKQLDNLLYGIENLRKRGAPEEADGATRELADEQSQTTVKVFASTLRRVGITPFRASLALPFASLPFVAREASALAPPPARNMHSKVVIIGSGPAGHTAAIYAARADLQPVLYEGFLALGIAAGGQLTTTDEVENFPGFMNIQGATLMDNMRAQSEACGTQIVTQTVGKVDFSQRPFKFWLHPLGDDENLEEETHTADSIIIATGAKARRLDLPGEEQYWGNGVSACAVCDGSLPIFRQKPLVVIGGGDSAVEEAIYLTKKASKVTVLVRKDQLRASKANARRLSTNPKVEIKYNTVATQITGEDKPRGLMTGLTIKNTKSGEEESIEANGLFYAVGHEPATTLFKGQLKMDEDGYLITEPGTTHTNVEGAKPSLTIELGSGCIAALEAEKFLAENDAEVEKSIEDQEVKKSQTDSDVPEYKQNPLL